MKRSAKNSDIKNKENLFWLHQIAAIEMQN